MSWRRRHSFWRLLVALGAGLVLWGNPLTTGSAGAQVSVDCGFGGFAVNKWPTACWRPYAASSPFNRPLPPDPRIVPNSKQIVRKILSMGPVADLVVAPSAGEDWYHPSYYPAPGDPTYTVHCVVYSCEIEGMRVRIPAQARPATGGDGHMAVIDQASGWEWDFWQVRHKPAGGGLVEVSAGGRTSVHGDGLGSDANAGQWGLLGGVIRAQELASGRIDHALFMVVGCTRRAHVYPAGGLAASCDDETNAPAVGQHLQLAMSDAAIDGLAVPEWKKTILTALARYGAFVGDTGGTEAFTFQFESGSTYRSFGVGDPLAAFAAKQTASVTARDGSWYFDLASGVDWSRDLRVLNPCVAEGRC
jgi:hypothetical protein